MREVVKVAEFCRKGQRVGSVSFELLHGFGHRVVLFLSCQDIGDIVRRYDTAWPSKMGCDAGMEVISTENYAAK